LIPKFILNKDIVNTKIEEVNTETSPITKTICINCDEEFILEKGFIVLKKGSDIVYMEDYPTFLKRYKTGQFEDWKIVYDKN
jgi:hypothetical protein